MIVQLLLSIATERLAVSERCYRAGVLSRLEQANVTHCYRTCVLSTLSYALPQSMQQTSIAYFCIEFMWHNNVCVKSDAAENKLKRRPYHSIWTFHVNLFRIQIDEISFCNYLLLSCLLEPR